MSIIKNKHFLRNVFNLYHISQYSTISISNNNYDLHFKSNFSNEEQTKILNILNGSSPDELSSYNVSQTRIKNLINWKSKKGEFKSLSDVLEVEGLGEKVLERICANIITESLDNVKIKSSNYMNKKIKHLLTPNLTADIEHSIKSAVGIHLDPAGVSWAKLSREQNSLNNWNFEKFSSLPHKLLPAETFNLAISILRKIPFSDVYIFEGSGSSLKGQMQSTAVSSYSQQLELMSMLIALLNTSAYHNVFLQKIASNEPQKTIENKVFHLRSKVPARLFKTLMGKEKVAALKSISQLIDGSPSLDFSLPVSPLTMEPQLKKAFHSQSAENKELLGQALMLIVSFMDLCIYKNPISFEALIPVKNK